MKQVLLLLLTMMMMMMAAVIPTLASSFNSSSDVNSTSSWEDDNETTNPSSDWNSTAVTNSSIDDDYGTTAEPTTAEPSITSFWQYQAMLRWFKYTPPVLIVLATVGNTLSVITLQNPMTQQAPDLAFLRRHRWSFRSLQNGAFRQPFQGSPHSRTRCSTSRRLASS